MTGLLQVFPGSRPGRRRPGLTTFRRHDLRLPGATRASLARPAPAMNTRPFHRRRAGPASEPGRRTDGDRLRTAVLTLATAVAHVATTSLAAPSPPARGTWQLVAADAPVRGTHAVVEDGGRLQQPVDRFVVDAAPGTRPRIEMPVGPAAVIDEFQASVWIRANRPDIRLVARVVLPRFISRKTGRPLDLLIPGPGSREVGRWEQLAIDRLPTALARRLPALLLEHGTGGDLAGAAITHLLLDLQPQPGRHEIDVEAAVIEGNVTLPAGPEQLGSHTRDPRVVPASAELPVADATDPPAGLSSGVIDVAGVPFFPRAIEHRGEPLATLAGLGFNCVRLFEPATRELLVEARQAGMWVICPPLPLPDVDVRDPTPAPVLRNWDRVLMWDLGSGLAEADVEPLAERSRRVKECDLLRPNRPVIAAADSAARGVSRHVDMLVARRAVLGTSLELGDYLGWLRERPRLARPGTPLLATLATEIDAKAARQAALLAGVGSNGLAVDPESLSLASLTAVAAGVRGIFYSSSRRIDGSDTESRARAAAVRETNLRLAMLEPWGAAGRFSAPAQTSSPDVQAFVLEAARARMVLVWRAAPGAQICARRYDGAVPLPNAALTVLVPGVPEAHQAWEVAPGGLRPLAQRRGTGGVIVTLDDFATHALILISGEPAVTAHVQAKLRETLPAEVAATRTTTALVLAAAARVLEQAPARALGNLPVAEMLGAARQAAVDAEAVLAADPAAAATRYRRAAAIAGQFERLVWERGVQGTGSIIALTASPLAVSDATLVEQWRFTEAIDAATPGAGLLAGGGMERVEDLAAEGWRHFAQPGPDIRTKVEVVRDGAFAGIGSLLLAATPTAADAAPIVVETPPVWVTTPPLRAPAGKLLEISARVWVPEPIRGSVDGLLVFDSLGGPALADRVRATRDWRQVTLYRIVPPETEEPLVVTFALTGLGRALVDEVSVRVVEPGGSGVPAQSVALPQGGFPAPSDLLSPPSPGAGGPVPGGPKTGDTSPAAPAQAGRAPLAWPGMNLGWPALPGFRPTNTPPVGDDGGSIDPFRRARGDDPAPE